MRNLTVWQTKPFDARVATTTLLKRGAIFVAAMLLLVAAVGFINPIAGGNSFTTYSQLERSFAALESELAVARTSVERAQRIFDYSARFEIPADLAAMINDVSLSEGIDPELAFRLVAVESGFVPGAISPMGAIGIAQVMLGTARYFDPEITRLELLDPETNLRIGLKHLGYLLDRYVDEELALLAYNRGTNRIAQLVAANTDPRNGYASTIMEGYLR